MTKVRTTAELSSRVVSTWARQYAAGAVNLTLVPQRPPPTRAAEAVVPHPGSSLLPAALLLVLVASLNCGCHNRRFDNLLAQAKEAETSGRPLTAAAYYAEALKLHPADQQLRLRLAGIYFDGGDYFNCAPHYQVLSRLMPENEIVRERAAYVLLRLRQDRQLEITLEAELKQHPQSLWAREYQADLLALRMSTKEALGQYRSLLDDPALQGKRRLEVRVKRGRALFATGQKPEALAEFEGVARIDPSFYEAQILRANYYLATSNSPAAAQAYRELRQHFPKADEPVIGLAALAVAEGRAEEALRLYETANELNPDRLDALFWIAELHYQREDAAALQALEHKVKATRPKSEALLHYLQAMQRLLQSDFQGALPELQRAYPFVRSYPGILDKLGQCHLKLGHAQEAETFLTQVEHEAPVQRELWLGLAQAHLINRDYFRALRFIKVVPANDQAPMLAQAQFGIGDYAESLKAARRWLDLDPQSVPAHLIAAESAARLNLGTGVSDHYRRVAELQPDSPAGLYARAQLLLGDRRLDEAAKLLLENQARFSELAGVNLALGQIYFQQARREQAERYLRAALKLQPSLAHAEALLGFLAMDKQDNAEARRAFDRALRLNPGERAALSGTALLHWYAGEYAPAADRFRDLLATGFEAAGVHQMLALCEFELNHPLLALTAARRAWELNPKDRLSGYLTLQAETWNRHGAEASTAFQRCLKLDPNYAPFYHGAALLALSQNQLEQALSHTREGLRRDPKSFLLRPLECELLRKLQRRDEAAQAVKRLTAEFPNEALAWVAQGNAALDARRFAEARQAYRQALKLGPREVTAQQRMLDSYVLEGQLAKAVEEMDKILAGDPGNQALRFTCARLHAQFGRKADAEHFYRQILEAEPKNVATLNNLATLLAGEPKQRPEAIRLAQRALTLDGRNPAVADTLATIYLADQQAEKARLLLLTARQAAPNNPAIWLHFIEALLATDKRTEAQTEFNDLVRRFPTYARQPEAERLKARLAALESNR